MTQSQDQSIIIVDPEEQIYKFGHAEEKGKRPTMEDSTVIAANIPSSNYSYFAIFDGHGGPKVSLYAGQNIYLAFKKYFNPEQSNVVDALKQACDEVNEHLVSEWPEEGCTAGIIVVSNTDVYSINLGDVRAVLVHPDGTAERLSYDHKASDPAEKEMIQAQGIKVFRDRILGILAVTRALGDGEFEGIISTEPYVKQVKREDGAKLILACDGVWDVLSDDEAAQLVSKYQDMQEAATALVKESLDKQTTDNVSCIVVDLTPK